MKQEVMKAGGGQPPPTTSGDVQVRAREDLHNADFGSKETGEVFPMPYRQALQHAAAGLVDILDKPPNPMPAVGVAKQQFASPAAQASPKKTPSKPNVKPGARRKSASSR